MSLPIQVLTVLHVVVSLIGIATGAVVVYGMLSARDFARWVSAFLLTTILTSATGFLFPFVKLLPSHIVGAISLVLLAAAITARYKHALAYKWRLIYVVCSVSAFYLNVFVGIVQAFLKIPSLKALAPTQADPPFLVVQLVVLISFLVLGVVAGRTFRPTMVLPAATEK